MIIHNDATVLKFGFETIIVWLDPSGNWYPFGKVPKTQTTAGMDKSFCFMKHDVTSQGRKEKMYASIVLIIA